MLNNFVKVAFRNILKRKGYSIINIAGLSVGIAAFLLIMLFVQGELGYDRFHRKADQIYRIGLKFHMGSQRLDLAQSPLSLANVLEREYPEVEDVVRLVDAGDRYVRYQDEQFAVERFFWADSTIFDVFDITILKGDLENSLTEPNSVIITDSEAKRIFGDIDPIGKLVTVNDTTLLTVTAVRKEFPSNSHMHPDFIGSLSTLPESREENWISLDGSYTYAVLSEEISPEQFEARLQNVVTTYIGPLLAEMTGSSYDEFVQAGNSFIFFLEPLTDIYLRSEVYNQLEPGGSYMTVVLFAVIACIILIVACINFVNLATARSTERANEVGVRKAVGSSRGELIRQFLAESIFLCAIAVVVAVVIVSNFIPLFNSILDTNLSLSFLTAWYFVPSAILLTVLVGLLAGMYPAFVLSSYHPTAVLKGKYGSSSRGRVFRSTLVVFQFAATIVLFVGTVIVHQQIQFVRDKELGYNKDHVIVIDNSDLLGTSRQTFKEEITRHAGVTSGTYSDGLPEMMLRATFLQKEGARDGEYHTIVVIDADEDFARTYELTLLEGRYFDRNLASDTMNLVLNETAVKEMELTDPIGKRLLSPDGEWVGTVIGVVKDFHLQSLHDVIRPMALGFSFDPGRPYLSLRVQPGRTAEVMGRVETLWGDFVPNRPVEYASFDESFANDYSREVRISRVVSSFSLLAILIACLGLFGLASFTAGRRAKEIAIRKVLGASVAEVIVLLSRQSVLWVVIANLVGAPVAYYFMSKWLESFAYRIDMSATPFLLAGVSALMIALLTVSYQAIKAARANPVDAIQYE